MFNNSIFGEPPKIDIPEDVDVIFVADMFVEDYVGGAELTSEALIESSPVKVLKVHAKKVTMDLLERGHSKYWVFGNATALDYKLIPTVITNLNYSILEYDYKFCKYRSVEKHLHAEQQPCNCEEEIHGKLVSNLFYHAKSLWFMSEQQLDVYLNKFPFLSDRNTTVLSSVFGDNFWITLQKMKEENQNKKRNGWIVLGSTSWIKGQQAAIKWCEDNNKDYEVVWNVPYEQVLEKMASAEGFVYLPEGGDTCPRMVIEAKLLGCKLHLNDNVQHAKEIWFDTPDLLDTESYLYAARERFWNAIIVDMNYVPTISGYTTSYNCLKNKYPFQASIRSMLAFCDEVIVMDGGSNDGTWEELQTMAALQGDGKLKVYQNNVDWSHPRFAIQDGLQKARARDKCTSEFCWQQDADEVVHENDYEKIKKLLQQFPKHIDLVSLPVVEYWGGYEKVRMDVTPWKWRLSKNNPEITHGIPAHMIISNDDDCYAKPGTDGCDYIFKDSSELVPHASFYAEEVHKARVMALNGDSNAFEAYSDWFKRNVELLPCVHHYSWFNLERKIKVYRDYWSKHWQSLYNIPQEDTVENNMFFDKCWSDVTEEDITNLATRLKAEKGGWVFHEKVNWTINVPHLTLDSDPPELAKDLT